MNPPRAEDRAKGSVITKGCYSSMPIKNMDLTVENPVPRANQSCIKKKNILV